MREKLRAAGGASFDAATLAALGGGRKEQLRRVGDSDAQVVVNALVRVTAGGAYEAGPLTPWHREGELLRQYFDDPLDCYELRITDMRQVCEPVSMVLKRDVSHKGEGLSNK